MIIPTATKMTPNGERAFDIVSRLLDDRIIMLTGEINDDTAQIIIAELLYLNGISDNSEIQMFINSPGGSVSAGLAIIDTMNYIKAPVRTIGTGICASMGAMILLSGEKGMRSVLPHSEVMIHQPLGGANGQASDIKIMAEHILKTQKTLYEIISERTGKDLQTIEKDCDRDNYMSAKEALDYGLIDEIIQK